MDSEFNQEGSQTPAAGEPLVSAEGPAATPPQPRGGNRGLKLLAGLVVAVALAVGLYFLNSRWIAPAVSQPVKAAGSHPTAPDFSLTDLNGQKLTLAEYRGKVVVLDFWATWCGPCRIEIPEFIQMQDQYRSQGLAVIGVSMDKDPQAVVDFYRQFHMNYPVVMGTDQISALYGGIFGLPTTFVIGRDGRIYSMHSGTTPSDVFEREVKQLLAADGSNPVDFTPAGATEDIELGTPGEANSEVPGVDITKLTKEQLVAFEKVLAKQQCTCGCKRTLLNCRREDSGCGVSRAAAREQLAKFLGAPPADGSTNAAAQSGTAAKAPASPKI